MTQEVEQIIGIRGAGKTYTLLLRVGPLQDDYDLVVFVATTMKQANEIARFVKAEFWDLEIEPDRFMVVTMRQIKEGRIAGIDRPTTASVIDDYHLLTDEDRDVLAQQRWTLSAVTTDTE